LLAGLAKDDFWSEVGDSITEWPWMMIKIICYALGVIGLIWLVLTLFRYRNCHYTSAAIHVGYNRDRLVGNVDSPAAPLFRNLWYGDQD
jgi:membrane protein YdbS with pleckstrin-like domain